MNRYVAALLSAWRISRDSGLIEDNLPYFKWRREGKGRDRVPTRQEVAAILRALRARGEFQDANLTRFLYRTGCRLGEALQINAGRFDGLTFRLPTSKSGHPRTIIVPVRLQRWCYKQQDETTGRLFDLPPSTFSAHWRAARQHAGLGDWFVPHSLRHARATEMVRAGVPLPTVAKALGHESIKTTMRYTHPSEQDVAEALER